jgi:hypothetical protein
MKALSLEDFTEHYRKHGSCPGDFFKRKKVLNERQIRTKYETYLRKETRQYEKHAEDAQAEDKDERTRNFCRRRDKTCQLRALIVRNEKKEAAYALAFNAGGFMFQLDVAHVFGKGAHPWMRHEPDNVVLLNRYSHTMLDTLHSPIDGRAISKAEQKAWWIAIIGAERYARLDRMSRKELSVNIIENGEINGES